MAKNNFDPFVLMMIPEPSPTTVVGGGTGQSTTDPYPCEYEEWLTLFAYDYTGDGNINKADYLAWFQATFPDEWEDLWELFGPTAPDDPSPIIVVDPGIEP